MKGIYHATYYVLNVEAAVALLDEMREGTISSFGEGDDQWEGIDFSDPGASAWVVSGGGPGALTKVEIRVPVEVVPADYWLSPYQSDSVTTFRVDGSTTGGEACKWGMLDSSGKRPIRFPQGEGGMNPKVWWVAIPLFTEAMAESVQAEVDDKLGYRSAVVPATKRMGDAYDRGAKERDKMRPA